MTRLWEAECIIEPKIALSMIAEQFPSINLHSIQILGAGWDNTAFLINGELVFRFPRRKIAVPLLEAERCLLPYIADRLPLAIPKPQWYGSPSKDYPWPFLGYKILPGTTACRVVLSDEERTKAAPLLAEFLSILHKLPVEEFSQYGLSEDTLGRVNRSRLVPIAKKNLEELFALGLMEKENKLYEIVDASSDLKEPSYDTLVHGDFYARHFLVNSSREVTGVIDWGDVHLGCRAVDLIVVHSFLPRQAQERFLAVYGEVDENLWKLAELRALFHSSWLALYGHHSSDEAIKYEGLRALKQIAR
jgi:aminoglycoside phosphotransferase (APT) family kinase protein